MLTISQDMKINSYLFFPALIFKVPLSLLMTLSILVIALGAELLTPRFFTHKHGEPPSHD